ncbi:restriction endonuclease subunit S, partial [Salmonella enterica]|uniref:restriction endonuclease subunit S n=1 Tax=Salmonella enterica TaxID=28901 RepID=UPI0030B3E243
SILQVCIGGSAGKTCRTITTVAFNQQINGISPYISLMSTFLFLALCAPLTQAYIETIKAGTATPIINKRAWSQFLIPIPPLSEQVRIYELFEQLR